MRSMRVVGALLSLATCGCYTYQPMDASELTPGESVRARLTAEQTDRLSESVPVADREVTGTVVESDGSSVLLLVPVPSGYTNPRAEALHQRVQIPLSGIASVDQKRLDRARTGLAAGAGALAVGAIVIAAIEGGGRADRVVTGPPPTDTRISIRLLHIGH